MTPRQKVFTRAIDLLKQGGWVQGDYRRNGGFCAVGAIQEAAVELEIEKYMGYSNTRLVSFNDKKGRTAPEVIAKLQSMKGNSK